MSVVADAHIFSGAKMQDLYCLRQKVIRPGKPFMQTAPQLAYPRFIPAGGPGFLQKFRGGIDVQIVFKILFLGTKTQGIGFSGVKPGESRHDRAFLFVEGNTAVVCQEGIVFCFSL